MLPVTRLLFLVLVVAATAGVAGEVPAFRRGPVVLEQVPTGLGKELGSVLVSAVLEGAWPQGLLARVKTQLKVGGVLLVGWTNEVGPRALNRSLGFQYAAEAARRLSAAVGAELWRFGCASRGEELGASPTVSVFAWAPPPPDTEHSRPLTLLEPSGPSSSRSRLWAFWEKDAGEAVWAVGNADGEVLWNLDPDRVPASLPFPARGGATALGVTFPRGEPVVVHADQPSFNEDRRLALRPQTQGSWNARLEGRLPADWSEPLVWLGGIPYPVVPVANGRFELDVALMPSGNKAVLQAVDPMGRVLVGPVLELPDGVGEAPSLLAVLVWEKGETDLDLHAWSGERHTDPQEPDDAFSKQAVAGTRLLFDGDGGSPASALVADGAEPLELEVQCYSDLGVGTRAWMYVVSHPGDPLRETRRILGPRRLSGSPLEARWPVVTWRGK